MPETPYGPPLGFPTDPNGEPLGPMTPVSVHIRYNTFAQGDIRGKAPRLPSGPYVGVVTLMAMAGARWGSSGLTPIADFLVRAYEDAGKTAFDWALQPGPHAAVIAEHMAHRDLDSGPETDTEGVSYETMEAAVGGCVSAITRHILTIEEVDWATLTNEPIPPFAR